MLSRARPTRRIALLLEKLEDRFVLSGLTIRLDPVLDRYGDQIVTVQGYKDGTRTAFGIFDTGSSAVTFSAGDQEGFTLAGVPIPIKVPDGAVAKGIGGRVVGDVSEPDTVWAGGMGTAQLTFDEHGHPVFISQFDDYSASVANVQVFVGTESGSPSLPTIAGTPILMPSGQHPQGRAALIDMAGAQFDFSPGVPGLSVAMPNLRFVSPGYQLNAGSGTSGVVKIPLTLQGGAGQFDANGVTEAPNPVQSDVALIRGTIKLGGKRFLFDTGAQMSVVTPQVAELLYAPGSRPSWIEDGSYVGVSGTGGGVQLKEIVVDGLEVPSSAGTLRFDHAPLVVSNLENGLDGILGMNLFNSALSMMYDPYGSSSLQVVFDGQASHGPGINAEAGQVLGSLGVPFAGAFSGTSLPVFTVASGQITGKVFLDNDDNGFASSNEAGVGQQTVYLDANHNGQLDSGETSATTAADGSYRLSALLPGTYTVRQVLPPGLTALSASGGFQVSVSTSSVTSGWDFGVVNTSPDEVSAYVSGLYGTILGRAADARGLASWTNAIKQGKPREQVVRQIWESAEHRGMQVDRYYAVFLHRQADAAGRAIWVRQFLSGQSEIDVQRGFLMSREYQTAHDSNPGFLTGLYVDILSRTPDPAGQDVWLRRMNSGVSRAQVAQSFLTSEEAYRQALDRYYSDFLHRPADAVGMGRWATALTSNRTTLEQTAIAFLVSDEFRNRQDRRMG